jgi:hypothetical protein
MLYMLASVHKGYQARMCRERELDISGFMQVVVHAGCGHAGGGGS